MNNIIKEIQKYKIGDYLENILMSKHTTYRVGGITSLLVYPKTPLKLIKLIKILKNNNIKYRILGNGSNVVFGDKLYDGVIIKLDAFNHLKIKDNFITVGAGYDLIKLAYELSEMGLSGLEFAGGIPGKIGGSIYMNAGAYNADMASITSKIKVITPDLEIKEIENKDLDFGYRKSFLKNNAGYICIEATLVLKPANRDDILKLIKDRREKRLSSQPLEYPSAGSVFRNPQNDYAGRLIEDIGLKGHMIGGAQISSKHANFIINYNQAKAEDIKQLIYLIKDEVKNKHGIELQIEQEFINWE